MKRGWVREFEHEKNVYKKLKAFQGDIIPRYLGEAFCENWIGNDQECWDKNNEPCVCQRGEQAMILSDLGETALTIKALQGFDEEQVRSIFLNTLTKMINARYIQEDCKFDNYHLVQGRLFLVDLEKLEYIPDNEDELPLEEYLKDWVGDLIKSWKLFKQGVE